MRIGERVLLCGTGAYTTAYERFNGLAYPTVVPLDAGAHAGQRP